MTLLAIDLGGTQFRAGLPDPQAPHRVTQLQAGPAPADRDGFLAEVGRLVAEHGATRLGVAVPGTTRGTICAWIPNLPYLDGLDLAQAFPGLSVGLGHDGQLALLAEATAGAAQGLSDAILVAIGTGIGSAVLSGGRVVRGSRGAACSLGWACADLHDPGDERDGWLEKHASGRALDRAAALIGLSGGRDLVEAARLGDPFAIAALTPPAHALGTALAGPVAMLDPQAIIFTGGVASALDVLGALVRERLVQQLPRHLRDVRLVAGSFGPGASLAGAGIAASRGSQWEWVE